MDTIKPLNVQGADNTDNRCSNWLNIPFDKVLGKEAEDWSILASLREKILI